MNTSLKKDIVYLLILHVNGLWKAIFPEKKYCIHVFRKLISFLIVWKLPQIPGPIYDPTDIWRWSCMPESNWVNTKQYFFHVYFVLEYSQGKKPLRPQIDLGRYKSYTAWSVRCYSPSSLQRCMQNCVSREFLS